MEKDWFIISDILTHDPMIGETVTVKISKHFCKDGCTFVNVGAKVLVGREKILCYVTRKKENPGVKDYEVEIDLIPYWAYKGLDLLINDVCTITEPKYVQPATIEINFNPR